MNKIVALPAFKDNYIWAIHSLERNEIVVVDPGDSIPVLAYLQQNHLNLNAILLTHHHWDHSNGILALLEHFPAATVYGSAAEDVPGVTHPVKQGDVISLPADFELTLKVLDIPGHTKGHIAYVGPEILFCGDTLFSCGCGRLFEGTPSQMVSSLEKIKQLSPKTLIFAGHEYTLANIAFAKQVEPKNIYLEKRLQQVKILREKNLPSLPVSLENELQTNPFLRCEQADVISATSQHAGELLHSTVEIFTHLRGWKNHF